MNNSDVSRAEILSYIHDLLGDLQRMAHSANFPRLAYYIDMASIESSDALLKERKLSLDGQERDRSA
jgi:hypothetical protein